MGEQPLLLKENLMKGILRWIGNLLAVSAAALLGSSIHSIPLYD
jgi:hypothetical protein